MPKTVLLDEWHVTFRIPSNLPDATVRSIRRVLNGKALTAAVRRALSAVVRRRAVLKPLRLTLARRDVSPSPPPLSRGGVSSHPFSLR